MLPTSKWKLRHTMRKMYEERIVYVEENLKIQRAMAGEFLDARDYEAVASLHLIIIQDEEVVAGLQAKLDLLNDDSCFDKAYNEQTETRDEDDG